MMDGHTKLAEVLSENKVLKERISDMKEQMAELKLNREMFEMLKSDRERLNKQIDQYSENNETLRESLRAQKDQHDEIAVVWSIEIKSLKEKVAQLSVIGEVNQPTPQHHATHHHSRHSQMSDLEEDRLTSSM